MHIAAQPSITSAPPDFSAGSRRPIRRSPVEVRGVVIYGDRRGRELGFPTANLSLDGSEPIHEGVYAGTVTLPDSARYASAVSVGRRASFYARDAVCLLGAHLLDFSGDLYGKELHVVLCRHLRPQTRYTSVEALIDQIAADVDEVRRLVGPLGSSAPSTISNLLGRDGAEVVEMHSDLRGRAV